MSGTYLRYMDDSPRCINDFTAACDDLLRSKFIIADAKIAAILKIIAGSRRLYELFGQQLLGYDFERELEKIRVPAGKDVYRLVMPKEKGRFAAFVFCVLYYVDTRALNFNNFISVYFPSEESVSESYQQFLSALISGFKQNTVDLFYRTDEEHEGADESEEERRINAYFETDAYPGSEGKIRAAELEGILSIINAIVKDINNNSALNAADKEEMLAVCEGLSNAVISKSRNLIRVMWIALKHTLTKDAADFSKRSELGRRLKTVFLL